ARPAPAGRECGGAGTPGLIGECGAGGPALARERAWRCGLAARAPGEHSWRCGLVARALGILVAEVEYPQWDEIGAHTEHVRPEAGGVIKRFLETDESHADLYGKSVHE